MKAQDYKRYLNMEKAILARLYQTTALCTGGTKPFHSTDKIISLMMKIHCELHSNEEQKLGAFD